MYVFFWIMTMLNLIYSRVLDEFLCYFKSEYLWPLAYSSSRNITDA